MDVRLNHCLADMRNIMKFDDCHSMLIEEVISAPGGLCTGCCLVLWSVWWECRTVI